MILCPPVQDTTGLGWGKNAVHFILVKAMRFSRNTALVLLFLISACTQQRSGETPQRIILDSDMGSDCDDLGALALLHSYEQEDKVAIVAAVYSSGRVPYGAGVIDAVNTSFGNGDIPIGAYHGSDIGDPVDKMDSWSLAIDTALYGHDIVRNSDAVDQTVLLRHVLAGQPDSSVTYITLGHTKGLYDLLVSVPDTISGLNGAELIALKVKRWVALGALNADNDSAHFVKDWNFFFNGTAFYTVYLVENFPATIYFVDGGADVLTGASLAQVPPENIVRRGYEQWLSNVEDKTLKDQRPSWDLATVHFAVEGERRFFSSPDNGWLECDTVKGCRWRSGSNRGRYFVKQKAGTSEAFADYLNGKIKSAILSANR